MLFVYDLIEELCQKKGVTVTAMCRDCKIPRSIMTDYKKGRIKTLSTDTVCKLADYFEVSVGYICGTPMPAADEEALKALLFGKGVEVTEQMWQEVKDYAEYIKQKYKKQ